MRNYTPPPVPSSVWKNPLHFVAFGFGSGALPYAPGTFGTLMAIPFYYLMRPLSLPHYFIALVIIALASIWICDRVSRDIGVHDHQGMCLDEFIGYFVTMFNAPHGIIWVALGFGLFRLFDIWKPWPIRQVDEKVPGGIGMILDDILAGIYSLILLQLTAWIIL